MCMICVELQRGNLKAIEARRNLFEQLDNLEPEHIEVVNAKIVQKFQDEAEAEEKL